MSHPDQILATTSTMNYSTTNGRIEVAIEALKSQEGLSVRAAAREYGVDRSTLGRRFNGECRTRAEAASIHRQNLTDVEEDTLIGYINSLTDRHIPPTPQLVRNLAEELISRPVGKNWTAQFIKRHSHRLTSVYLRPLDRARVSAESSSHFDHFYALVLLFSQC